MQCQSNINHSNNITEEVNVGENQKAVTKLKMATALKLFPPYLVTTKSTTFSFLSNYYCTNVKQKPLLIISSLHQITSSNSFCIAYRYNPRTDDDDDDDKERNASFNEAAALFNEREYYKCHDLLETMWFKAEEPTRTLLHGILQCSVGFYHLFNQNHKGAMMELGEGLCKLRKMKFESRPFLQFEQEISDTLSFIYNTQLELAACADDMCLAMDQSERSYQLLGSHATGQLLYSLQNDNRNIPYIIFNPQRSSSSMEPSMVKLPTLTATEEHLRACENL
ncbi:hypothetical protein K2173_009879 [Erythroxylum novogranatense]|uniref:DUF309 domain-containing protein n=1 Tax=Erythroxylum novogranatense TaxID=1862640 RepID=A0AAV8SZN6_9ROSI|nr:hypothetical protein K2173_009879 [Erythroxylum novogranatense]